MDALQEKFVTVLRWTERYTKTDMVYLLQGSTWITLLQGVTAIVGLLASIVFANTLAPETFGEYKYILSVAGILAAFTLPGINTALSRAAAKNFDGSLAVAWRAKLIWGSVASALSIGTSLFYLFKDEIVLSLAFLVVALFLPAIEASLSYYAFLTGKSFFREAATKQAFVVVGATACIVLSTLWIDNTLVVASAYFIAWAFFAFLAYAQTKKRFVKNTDVQEAMVTYGTHLSIMNIIGSIAAYLDKILLFNFLGPTQVALFSFATVLPQNVKSAIRNISQVAFPKFAQKTLSHIGTSLHTKVLLATTLSIPLALVYWICAPFIFKFFFPQYTDAILFSQLYGLIIIFASKVLYKTALEANGRKRELYIFQITSSSIKIFLSLLFIFLFGIAGAVYATLLTEVLVFILIATLFESAKRNEVTFQEETKAV